MPMDNERLENEAIGNGIIKDSNGIYYYNLYGGGKSWVLMLKRTEHTKLHFGEKAIGRRGIGKKLVG